MSQTRTDPRGSVTHDQRTVEAVNSLTSAVLDFGDERAATHVLLVDLVAFVDTEHESDGSGCHPQPGVDCYVWCEACKLLERVPADVLADARLKLRERGVDRD